MSKETTLSNRFTRRGVWWVPAKPETRVPGMLTYDPAGEMQLELDGTLRDNISKGAFDYLHLPCILGDTLDGKACTLVDAYESNFQLNWPGTATSKFLFNELVIGHDHVDPASSVYESVLIILSDLVGWMNRNPFKDQRDPGGSGSASVSTTYTMAPLVSVDVSSLGAAISIEPSVNISMDYYSRVMRYDEELRITPKTQQTAKWYMQALFKLRILLSLLVGRPVHIRRVQLCTSAEKKPELGGKLLRYYVDLCLKQVGYREEKELLPFEMPFTYPRLASDWPQILENWFNKGICLETMANLYFGVSVDRSIPIDFAFLALIQAIESYCRAHEDDVYVSDTEYEPIKRALIDAIPSSVIPDHREALKARIKYGNEYSLRKRLDLTLQHVPAPLVREITNDNDKFILQVVATRNYLTHRDETEKANALDFRGMFSASVNLKMLIEFLLLREIGIPLDKLSEVMTTHQRYRNRPKVL